MNGPLVLHRTQPNPVIRLAFLQIFAQFHVLVLGQPLPTVYHRIVDQFNNDPYMDMDVMSMLISEIGPLATGWQLKQE